MDFNAAEPVIKIIFILGIGENDNLIMSDGGESCAKRSDTIIWDISPESNIDEIIGIHRKGDSPDVFQEGPSREDNSRKWRGKIKDEFDQATIDKYLDPKTNTITEYYNIYYRKVGEEKCIHVYDPKLSVNN